MAPRSLDPAVQEQSATQEEGGRDIAAADLKIAVAIAKKTLKEGGGLEALKKGLGTSQDPAQVVSKFLVQLIMKIKDALQQQEIELSPNIILSNNGWLVQMVAFIEDELGLPVEFSEEVISDVMETFKAMVKGQQGGQPAAPAGPSQGMPPQPAPAQAGAPPMGG